MSGVIAAAQQQAQTLTALPLKYLFSAPFDAAVDAQISMALTTAVFLKQYGCDGSGTMFTFTTSSYYDIPAANVKDASGNQAYYLYQSPSDSTIPTLDPSGVGINYRAPVVGATAAKKFVGNAGTWDVSGSLIAIDDSGRIIGSQGQRSLTLPFISILNVPALSLVDVTVDFKMEIKTQDTSTTSVDNTYSNETETNSSYSARSWWGNRTWSGSNKTNTTAVCTNNRTATDTSSTTSVYKVHMGAKNKTPVGLKIMLDFITNNMSDSAAPMILSDDGYSTQPNPASDLLASTKQKDLTMM